MHTIRDPIVPFTENLNENLRVGSKITVHGKPHDHHGHSQDFAVELLSGPNTILHVNFRFAHGHHKEKIVVVNSYVDGSWGHEERFHNPIHHEQNFVVAIEVHADHYTIGVDGDSIGTFPHRIPFFTVQAVGVKGEANVEEVRFEGFESYSNWGQGVDLGHSGFIGYGTEVYNPPTFNQDHPHHEHFRRHRRGSNSDSD
uniref:Galectin n=1 Tax=Rhabditophanes sp. KR3021 TaxID=114890 RepID=A0AC35TV73_9BILA